MERSIVVGCGIGGLAAAAALSRRGADVLVLERDRLPDTPSARRGVPQGAQLHNVLTRAQASLERLVPGFCAALEDAGAGCARVAEQTHVFELGVRMPERDLGLRLMCAPRPQIEHVLRQLVLRRPNVKLLQDARATGLVLSADGAVGGVRVVLAGEERVLPATVVVDATGTPSRAPHWLAAIGREGPPGELLEVRQWYVSARFRRTNEWLGDDDFWMVFPTANGTRGGLVSPTSEDEWHVSVSGTDRDPKPRTIDEFKAYARSLEDPLIGELLALAQPTEEPTTFRKPTARWRRYEQLQDPVVGFLPLGDAVASLNPLFGQGMSVAAGQAAALADLFESETSLDALTAAHHAMAAEWAVRALTLGDVVERVALADAARFVRRLQTDPAYHRLYVRVWHLMEPASALL